MSRLVFKHGSHCLHCEHVSHVQSTARSEKTLARFELSLCYTQYMDYVRVNRAVKKFFLAYQRLTWPEKC